MKTIMLLVVLLSILPTSTAEEVKVTERTRGCHLLGCTNSGNCIFDFFVKVADNEYDSDDGEKQVWGYNPADIHKTKNGDIFYITIVESKFVKAGRVSRLEHTGCFCHCPAW